EPGRNRRVHCSRFGVVMTATKTLEPPMDANGRESLSVDTALLKNAAHAKASLSGGKPGAIREGMRFVVRSLNTQPSEQAGRRVPFNLISEHIESSLRVHSRRFAVPPRTFIQRRPVR